MSALLKAPIVPTLARLAAPGVALAARVGSWLAAANVAPNGSELICTWRSRLSDVDPT